MIKVLQIPNYLYPHIGGIEQVARDIIASLNEEDDIEQRVICFNHENKTINDKVDGVNVTRVKSMCKVFSQELALSYNKELKKVLEEFKPDIVIFHYPNPLVAHSLLKYKKMNFKLILYWHLDITKQKILGKFFVSQSKTLLNWADKVIATSPNYVLGSKYLQEYKDKTMVIPNCVNNERVNYDQEVIEIANKIKEENKDKTIVFAFGRHVPYKGITYLIKASKLLDDEFAIFIGGHGKLTKALKKEACKDKKIKFINTLSDQELKAYLLVCDIFAFPSITKNEAFGIGLAEAMSFAKPSVTFTILGSGVNYVSLKNITGIEVENKNYHLYASALKTLKNNLELRLTYGENAKKRVNELFSEEVFHQHIKNLIGEYRCQK